VELGDQKNNFRETKCPATVYCWYCFAVTVVVDKEEVQEMIYTSSLKFLPKSLIECL